jgi:hypothetical protein
VWQKCPRRAVWANKYRFAVSGEILNSKDDSCRTSRTVIGPSSAINPHIKFTNARWALLLKRLMSVSLSSASSARSDFGQGRAGLICRRDGRRLFGFDKTGGSSFSSGTVHRSGRRISGIGFPYQALIGQLLEQSRNHLRRTARHRFDLRRGSALAKHRAPNVLDSDRLAAAASD